MKKILIIICLLSASLLSQNDITLMAYNLLNYTTSATRNTYFRSVINETNPSVIIAQEILNQNSVNAFLNNVLNNQGNEYSAGTFINGPDTDNAIFYKTAIFEFISNTPISTSLRDINQFKIVYSSTLDTLLIYSLHLKSSQGSTNEQRRLTEVQ